MTQLEQQLLVDRDLAPASAMAAARGVTPAPGDLAPASDERAARNSLKSQITRLEHQLSRIVTERFPHIPAPRGEELPPGPRAPRLPDLAELERERDRLAGRLQELRRVAAARTEHERRAREKLDGMRLEPGRYKFARVAVRDLGQGGCGVWQVRPRLGLIGMLAGWWQLKLSSGCPLPGGPR